MQCFPASHHFLPLMSKYSPQHPALNTNNTIRPINKNQASLFADSSNVNLMSHFFDRLLDTDIYKEHA
jgi:hypothetical protein